MSHLYVCHFSSGHIKVGRSIDPVARVAQHAASGVPCELLNDRVNWSLVREVA